MKLPKSNFCQSPISKDKFQTSNFKSSFQRQIFKEAKLSKSNCHSNFQSQISKVNSRLSERAFQSPPLFESQTIQIQTLESETFQSPILTGTFQKPTFSESSQILVSVRSRADKEEKVWFKNRFAVCVFSQPRKLSTSASEELAFNQLWRPEDSRQSSAGLFTSPVTCNVWLVEVKKPAWALVRRNVQELGETWWASMRFPFYTHRSLPRSSLPFDVVISHAKQAKEKTWRKRKKKPHGAQQPIGPITLPRRWSPGAGQTLAYSPRASVWPESARCSDPSLEKVFCFLWRLGAAVFFQKAETQKSFLGGRPKVRTEKETLGNLRKT